MRLFALDSSAVVAWLLQEEPRWALVDELLRTSQAAPILPAPAITEVLAVIRRRGNTSPPEDVLLALAARGVRQEMLVDADLVRAAELVGSTSGERRQMALSLGDSLILAVTERLGVPVVTCDRHWQELADAGVTSAAVVCL